MSLRGRDLAVPLLGFNLGLEIAQLAALALIALPVWLITRSRSTTWAVTGAIGVVAASWVVQRAAGVPNPLDRFVNAAPASPERLALVLLGGPAPPGAPSRPSATARRGPPEGGRVTPSRPVHDGTTFPPGPR